MNQSRATPAAIKFPLPVKIVLLDLDGTLVDSVPDLAAAANRMLRDLGIGEWGLEHYRVWVGNGVARLVKRALTGAMEDEPDAALFERAQLLFARHYGNDVSTLSRLYPHAQATLAQLSASGFKLVCVTNKDQAFTLPLLSNLDIEHYFGLVVAGDSVPRLKPDPLPLLHACEHFAVAPEHGVFIGDSANDVQAARAAGMPVICVSYGYNHGRDIRELGPDRVVDSLAEVPQYLHLYPA